MLSGILGKAKLLFKILIVIFFVLGSLELFCRLYPKRFAPYTNRINKRDERNLLYDHDPLLGWFPKKNSSNYYQGTVRINVNHGSQGFRDRDHGSKFFPRILFLGDSFVWGYDVEESARFTNILQEKFGNKMEILNFGVSGYGTVQAFLLLQQKYAYYKPEIVFLMFSDNDRGDNSSSFGYGYYRPYFIKDSTGRLVLKGVPVPLSLVYRWRNNLIVQHSTLIQFLIARLFSSRFFPSISSVRVEDITGDLVIRMKYYLKKKQSKLVVGFVSKDESLMKLCKNEAIPFLDFTSITTKHHFPTHGRHWTKEGHQLVAQSIYDFFTQKHLTA